MLREDFGRYVPDEWQDGGLVKAVSPKSSTASRILRKAEKWKAALTVGAFAFSAVVGGSLTGQFFFHVPEASAMRRTVIGAVTERNFVPTTAQFEVSPHYWLKLVERIKAWRPLPPDDDGPDLEPAI
jgi:hypothetical protein